MKEAIGVFTRSNAILHADACIIDEQDEHLVLTLRISKQFIRKNQALLACLSDAVGGPDLLRAATPAPPRRKANWPYAVLVCLTLALPSPFITNSFAGYPAPVEIRSVMAPKPVFGVGENIEIDFVYKRDRACQTTFDHLIERDTSEVPVFNERTYGSSESSTNGEYRLFRLILKPPTALPPGQYVYAGYNHSQCAKGGTYDIAYPHVTFTVAG